MPALVVGNLCLLNSLNTQLCQCYVDLPVCFCVFRLERQSFIYLFFVVLREQQHSSALHWCCLLLAARTDRRVVRYTPEHGYKGTGNVVVTVVISCIYR